MGIVQRLLRNTIAAVNSIFKTLQSATIAVAIIAWAGLAFAGGHSSEYTQEIAPGVYSYSDGGGHFHSMFLVTDDGVAAFESVNTEFSTKFLKAIRAVTDQPVRYIFQSHNHWDHAGGSKVFKDVGAKAVMHFLAAAWLKAHPGRDTSPPDIVWKGDRKDFVIGGKTVELHYLGLNHGLGMTVFVLPDTRTAFMADLVTPRRMMFAIVPDFNIGEWKRSLGEVLKLDFDVAVCAHNSLPPDQARMGCTKTHVAEQRQLIVDLQNAIIAEFQKSPNPDPLKVVGAVKLPKYADWAYYDEWLEMNAYRVMLDLWMGPFPWIPED